MALSAHLGKGPGTLGPLGSSSDVMGGGGVDKVNEERREMDLALE